MCKGELELACGIISQGDIIKPGGETRMCHRDYHLGFQSMRLLRGGGLLQLLPIDPDKRPPAPGGMVCTSDQDNVTRALRVYRGAEEIIL